MPLLDSVNMTPHNSFRTPPPPPGGGGMHSGTEGAAPALRISWKKGSACMSAIL